MYAEMNGDFVLKPVKYAQLAVKLKKAMILPAELMTAALLYMMKLQRRQHFILRAVGMGAATLILPILPLAGIRCFFSIQDDRGLLISLIYAALSYLAVFLFTFTCCRISPWEALYCAACAYALVLGANAQNLQQTSESLYQVCLLYAMVCCFLVLWTQTGQQKRLALQHELDIQQQLRRQQKAQYEMSAENVELINRKCHDLKYQIAALKHISDQKTREKSIQSMEQAVMIYDSVVKTGNDISHGIFAGGSDISAGGEFLRVAAGIQWRTACHQQRGGGRLSWIWAEKYTIYCGKIRRLSYDSE